MPCQIKMSKKVRKKAVFAGAEGIESGEGSKRMNYVLKFPTCSRSSRVSPLSLGLLGPLSLLGLNSSKKKFASN